MTVKRLCLTATCLSLIYALSGCGQGAKAPDYDKSSQVPLQEFAATTREIATPTPPPDGWRAEIDGQDLTFVWDLELNGDYNKDRSISGLDIFPLALHFGEESNFNGHTETNPGNDCIDGNQDGWLNGLDVFNIAINFGIRCDGWNIHSAETFGDPFLVLNIELITVSGGECLGDRDWSYPGIDWTERWFFIRSWDAAAELEGPDSELIGPAGAPNYIGIRVEPETWQAEIGEQKQFTAFGLFDDDTEVDVTASAVWESTSPPSAEVDASGLVSMLRAGDNIGIIASYGGLGDASVLTVSDPGQWTAEQVHTFGGEPFGGPRMFRNSEGSPVVVFSAIDWETGTITLWMGVRKLGEWDVEEVLPENGIGFDPVPSVSEAGLIGLASIELELDASPLHYSWNDGTWHDEIIDEDGSPNWSWDPRCLGLGYVGETPVVAYNAYDLGTDEEQIRIATRTSPGVWDVEVLETDVMASTLTLVVDPTDNSIHVFYVPDDWELFVDWIVHAWKISDGPWEFEEVVSDTEHWAQSLIGTLTPAGDLMIAYDYGDNVTEQWIATLDPLNGWEAELLSETLQVGNPAFNPLTGRLALPCWFEDSWTEELWWLEESAEGEWDASMMYESPDEGVLWWDFSLLYEADGTPIVAWMYAGEDPNPSALVVSTGAQP